MAVGRKTLGLRSFVANLAKHLCASYGGVKCHAGKSRNYHYRPYLHAIDSCFV